MMSTINSYNLLFSASVFNHWEREDFVGQTCINEDSNLFFKRFPLSRHLTKDKLTGNLFKNI